MVGVEVGEDDGIERRHSEAPQAPVDERRIRTGVHEHRAVGPAAQHHGVPLTDVAHDDPPALRWPGHRSGGNEGGGRQQRDADGEHRVTGDKRTRARPVRTTTTVMRASRSAPAAPSGHGSEAPGTSANRLATCAMRVVGTTPTHATSSAARARGPTPAPPPPRPPWRWAPVERRGSSPGSPPRSPSPAGRRPVAPSWPELRPGWPEPAPRARAAREGERRSPHPRDG